MPWETSKMLRTTDTEFSRVLPPLRVEPKSFPLKLTPGQGTQLELLL